MSPIDPALEQGFSNLLVRCLRHLVTFGAVTEQEVSARYYIRWDRAYVLQYRGHGAATTQDEEGRAVVYLDPDQQVHQLVSCIIHEATHVAQICRGDLVSLRGRGHEWCGERHDGCDAEDPAYLDQPWEIEAEEMVPRLISMLRESDPELEPLLDVLEKHQQSL